MNNNKLIIIITIVIDEKCRITVNHMHRFIDSLSHINNRYSYIRTNFPPYSGTALDGQTYSVKKNRIRLYRTSSNRPLSAGMRMTMTSVGSKSR